MTDLEITKACADALGLTICCEQDNYVHTHEGDGCYDPLRNDAQAMALMKRFQILRGDTDTVYTFRNCDEDGTPYYATNGDLNRAICECVANMHETVSA